MDLMIVYLMFAVAFWMCAAINLLAILVFKYGFRYGYRIGKRFIKRYGIN